MKWLFTTAIILSVMLTGISVQSQEQGEERHIIIEPGKYVPRAVPMEEPLPLDRTLKLTFKLSGPDGEKEIVLLCAMSIYSAEVKDVFNIGGTIRMIRNVEVLLAFDFEALSEKATFAGNGSIKIKPGEEKQVYKYGDYSVTIKVETETD